MAKPINLNKARKARTKLAKAKTAGENRVKFGQTKAEREAKAKRAGKAAAKLDGHKREP
jgi:hypothetical protein